MVFLWFSLASCLSQNALLLLAHDSMKTRGGGSSGLRMGNQVKNSYLIWLILDNLGFEMRSRQNYIYYNKSPSGKIVSSLRT